MNLINYISIFLLSITTTIIFIVAILYSDRKSKEPIHMIVISLFSGIFTICLTLLIEKFVLPNFEIISSDIFNYETSSLLRILLLSLIEEYSKLMVLYLFISKSRNFDDVYDGFLYSSFVALSFGAFETLIYVFDELDFLSMASLAILRSITSVPLHLICGIVMGYYVGVEKFSWGTGNRIKNLLMSLLIPTIIHFIYNYVLSTFIMSLTGDGLFLIFIITFFIPFYIIAISYIKRTKFMNDKYINNKKYKNLMTKTEYNEIIKDKY